jgi:hypothetical protein
VYKEFADAMQAKAQSGGGAGSGGAQDEAAAASVRTSLTAMSSMTAQMMQEVNRQTAETRDAAQALDGVKRAARELQSYATRFSAQLAALHESTLDLRAAQLRLKEDHDETHDVLIAHHATVGGMLYSLSEVRPHGLLSTMMLVVLQVLLTAGFAIVFKMGPRTTGGRIV